MRPTSFMVPRPRPPRKGKTVADTDNDEEELSRLIKIAVEAGNARSDELRKEAIVRARPRRLARLQGPGSPCAKLVFAEKYAGEDPELEEEYLRLLKECAAEEAEKHEAETP